MTVTVKRIGGSLAVVIPRAIAIESGLAEGVSLDVSHAVEGIMLRRLGGRRRRRIGKIAKAMTSASYRRRKHESDESSVGRENV